MRIISQNGLIDIPYDSIIIFALHDKDVSACTVNDNYNKMILGTYNDGEDALFVMKQIRRAANDGYTYYFMPSAKEVERYK